MYNNTPKQWREEAINMYKNGSRYSHIFTVLHQTHPDLTYEAVRGYFRYLKQKFNVSQLSNAQLDTVLHEMHSSPEPQKKAVPTPAPAPASSALVPDDAQEGDLLSVEITPHGATYERVMGVKPGKKLTVSAIMQANDIDENEMELVSYRQSKWQQTEDGTELYAVRITVRPKKNALPSFKEIEEHFKTFRPSNRPRHAYKAVSPKADTMYEVNIADLHLGKLARKAECGENYDFDIAAARFRDIIDQDIAKIQMHPVEEILFVWSNDFLNSDGIGNATTGGTPQDNCMTWREMYMAGAELLIEAIEKLAVCAPVKTFLIASNHPTQAEFYMVNHLYAWFRNEPRVTVDRNCKTRWYYRYGTNLIGFSHSHAESKKQLPLLMQVENSVDWGLTTYREFHMAHYHSEIVEEKGGIIFRWLPSVTGPDKWHEGSGFLGAVQRSYSFVWNKHVGLVGINVNYPRDRMLKMME